MAEKMVVNHKKSVQKRIVQKISALCKEIWELTGDECYFVALNKGTLLQTGTRKAVTFIQQNIYFLQALKEYCDKSCQKESSSSRKRRWENTGKDIQKREGQNPKHMEDQITNSVYKTVESSYQSVDSVCKNKDSGNQTIGNVCQTEYGDYKSVDSVCRTEDSGYLNIDDLCKTVDSGCWRMDNVCKTIDCGKQSIDSVCKTKGNGYQSIHSVCKSVDSTYHSTDSVCKVTYSMSKTGDCVCKIVDSGYQCVDSVCKVTDNVITDYLDKFNYNTCNTTGCIFEDDVCRTADSLCKTTYSVCKTAENMCLNTDNVCKTAENMCLNTDNVCKTAENMCLNTDNVCKTAENMCLNTDIVCKDSCQSPCEDNLEDFEDIIPFMLEGTEESDTQEDYNVQNELFPNNQLTVPKEYGVQWSECMLVRPDTLPTAQVPKKETQIRPDTLCTAEDTTEERVIVTESDKLDYFCKRIPRSYPQASRYKRRKRKR